MSGKPAGGVRKSRRKSREFAVQGLYQWALAGNSADEIEKQLREDSGYAQIDGEHFTALLRGVIAQAPQLDELLQPYLDRPIAELSPVEHAILRLACFEMKNHPEIPYRVVINEAVELAKSFGGTDGHKYVNGVLDKLAARVRAVEVGVKA
ncbi:MAG: transcription antitermination factor NusB [Gallionella sp.]|nr:transcription antitermination factor NusB [Gallionella sp.]